MGLLCEDKYDVTVIIATFNQNINRTILTIKSVLLQKGLNFQIVVTDDASINNNFDDIKKFLDDNLFTDYILVSSEHNQGTVDNILNGLRVSKGRYVKFISPGDLLYKENCLAQWVTHIVKTNSIYSYGKAVWYNYQNNEFKVQKGTLSPQARKVYLGSNIKKMKYYQLVYNDLCLGAATLIERESALDYLSKIEGKIKYAEDNIYRLMNAFDEKSDFYNENVILYESNTGISNQNNKWHNILIKEWYTVGKMILDSGMLSGKTRRDFKYYLEWKINNLSIRGSDLKGHYKRGTVKKLLRLYLHIPSMFFWHVRIFLFPRHTETNLDNNFLKDLGICNN